MIKRVLLLAVSCKNGGLCPGGIDLDNPSQWIRIVRNDGQAGAVQGYEIDFARPLDVVEFDGQPMPQGRQRENWVINNNSCKKIDTIPITVLGDVYSHYGYHGFWGNYKSSLNEIEFNAGTEPSESIMRVSDVRIYQNENGKTKIDFLWSGSRYPIRWISLTDQDYYSRVKNGEVRIANAYIVVSIPKDMDAYLNPHTGERQAFKFVSKVFDISEFTGPVRSLPRYNAPHYGTPYYTPPQNGRQYQPIQRPNTSVDDDLPF